MSTAKSISRMVSRQGICVSNGIVRCGQVHPAKPPPVRVEPDPSTVRFENRSSDRKAKTQVISRRRPAMTRSPAAPEERGQ
jgi:hypothetical protein